MDKDDDNDGIPDHNDPDGTLDLLKDDDQDGVPDLHDDDMDNDGVPDHLQDHDCDGIPDLIDPDDDDDGYFDNKQVGFDSDIVSDSRSITHREVHCENRLINQVKSILPHSTVQR